MLFSAASAAVFGLLYGFGDLSRSIQSVPAFRECVYRLDVGGFLLRVLLIRAAIAVFLAALFFLMACLIRRGHILILSELAFCGAEFALERGIPLAGTLNWLKCVNVFWLWQPRGVFGTYCNLDFFGYPVSKDAAGAVILAAFGLVVSCGGLCAFCLPKPPARTGGMNVRALKKGRPFFKAERLLAERVPSKVIVRPRAADVTAACSSLANAVKERAMRHYGQPALDVSATRTRRRAIGKYGGWGFASTDEADATLIEAVALAYWGAMTTRRNPNRKAVIRC